MVTRLCKHGDVAMFDEVVKIYARHECKDPRDTVYGFLELIPPWKEKLVVGYENKSTLKVFVDAARLGLLERKLHGGLHVAFCLW